MNKWAAFLFICSTISMNASASIDTVNVFSKSMSRNIKCVVVTPLKYPSGDNQYPVVYLLHGARGNYSNWVTRVPDMQLLADEYEQIIVCPDGNTTSWYFDSPVDSSSRFETHIAKELPGYIDAHYRTIPDREHRAISGLSMGGHGALFIAFRHAETFGSCGSMSGAFDVSIIPKSYGIEKVLGNVATHSSYYKDWSVLNLVDTAPKDSLQIIIDCGAQDFISYMSKALHEKMTKLKIMHDYIERPGRHDWQYWGKAVRYQLLFFKEYFKKAEEIKEVEATTGAAAKSSERLH